MKFPSRHLVAAATLVAVSSTFAATAIKTGTDTDLTAASTTGWSGGSGANGSPTVADVATWTTASLGAGLTAATNVTWGSIDITGAQSAIDISGAGSITTGNITLAGSQTLAIANAIALSGNATYSVADVTGDANADATLAGVISGTGFGITKTGAGTLILTGANTYTGGTTITAGTLQIGSGVTNGTLNGAYSVGSVGTLRYIRTADTAAPAWANITGAGTLSVATNRANNGTTNDWGAASLGGGFTGTLRIERGRVSTFGAASLGGATAVIVETGGQLGMWNGGTFTQNFTIAGQGYGESGYEGALRLNGTTLNGDVTLSGDATIGTAGTASTIAGVVSGGHGLTLGTSKMNGTIILTGANTYTGGTTIAAGTLQLGGTGSLGAGDYAGDIANAGVFKFSSSANQTLSGVISGAGSLTKDTSSASTLTLTGANTYTGTTTIAAGTLALSGGDNRLATTGTVNLSASGTLDIGATNQSLANLTVTNGATAAIAGSGTLNITGTTPVYVGTAGAATTLNLTGGTLTVAPTLYIGYSAVTSNTYVANGTVTVASGATLNAGTIDLGWSSYSSGSNAPSSTGKLTVNGAVNVNTLILGDATTLDRSYTVTSATVNLNDGGSLSATTIRPGGTSAGTGTSRTFNFNGGTISNNASGDLTINAFGGTTSAFVLGTGGTPTFDIGAGHTGTVNQAISGSGSLTKIGDGTLTLTAANTYAGATIVNAGTLDVTGSLTSAVIVNSGGTLSGTGSTTGTLTLANGATLVGAAGTAAGDNGAVFTAGDLNTSAGGILVTGAVGVGGLVDIVRYDGVWTGVGSDFNLSAFRAISGVTSVAGETGNKLQFTTGVLTDIWTGNSGTGTGTWDNTHATGVWSNGDDNKYYVGDAVQFNDLSGQSSATVTVADQVMPGTVTFNNGTTNYTLTGSGGITGTASLVKSGSGVATLNTVNTYSGDTTITAGTLEIGGAGSLGSGNYTGALDIGSGATFRYSSSENQTLSGVISGSGALVKDTAGSMLTLTGANTFTGDTTVSAGTLTLAGAGSLGAGNYTGALAIGSGGTFAYASSAAQTLSGVISGSGTMRVGGTGSVTFSGSGSNTFSGTLNIDTTGSSNTRSLIFAKTDGAFAIGADSVINFGTGTANEANLKMGASNQFDAGVVVNFNNPSGKWTRFDMKGTNQTLAGVNTGTLTTAGSGIIQNQGLDAVVPSGNAVLTLTGDGTYLFNGYIRDQDNGGHGVTIGLTKTGTGTQTLVGGNISYTGATTVNAGRLVLQNTAIGGAFTNNATVEFTTTGNATVVNGATLSGAGDWYKTGSGRSTLYNTTVNASGNIFVQAGTLSNDGNSSKWALNTASVDIADNAILDLYADLIRVDRLTGTGFVQNNFGNPSGQSGAAAYYEKLQVGANNGSSTFEGVIRNNSAGTAPANGTAGGGVDLEKIGSGTLTLTGANTYTGVTTISDGTLRLDFSAAGAGSANIIAAASALRLGDGTLEVKGGSGKTVTQSFNGVSGIGTLQLTPNGASSVNLTLGAIAPGSTLNFVGSDATVAGLGTANFLTTTVAGANDGTGRLGASLWNGTEWASTSAAGGTHVVAWSGAFTNLTTDGNSGANPTGDLRILGGTGAGIAATYSASSAIGSLLMGDTLNDSTLALGGNTLTVDNTASGTGAIAIAGDARSLTIGSAAGDGVLTSGASGASSLVLNNASTVGAALTVNSAVTNGASGSVSLTTSGLVKLYGGNTYTGSTTVTDGTLEIGGAGTLGSGNYAGAISNAGTLLFSTTANQTLTGAIANAGTLSFSTSANQTLSGVVSGAGVLNKSGSGTLTLSGANTYTGATTITGGTLKLGVAAGLGASSLVTVASGGTLDVAGLAAGRAVEISGTGAGTAALYNSSTTAGGSVGSLKLNADATVASAVPGADTGKLFGTGFLDLNGKTLTVTGGAITVGLRNVTSGNIVINNGATVYATNGGSIANATGIITVNTGGLFEGRDSNNTGMTTLHTITLNGGRIGTATMSGNNGGGAGTILKNNITVDATNGGILDGNNTTFGVYLRLAGSIAGSGALTLRGGKGVEFQGDTSGYIGTATAVNGSVSFNPASGTQTFNGILAGARPVVKNGAGTTVFTNTNIYTGGTTVSAGTLQIGNGGATGSVSGNIVVGDAALAYNLGALTLTNNISHTSSGVGSVDIVTAGATSLAGRSIATTGGALNVTVAVDSGGTLSLGGATLNTGTGALTVSTTNRSIDTSGTLTIANTGAGTANITGQSATDYGFRAASGSVINTTGNVTITGKSLAGTEAIRGGIGFGGTLNNTGGLLTLIADGTANGARVGFETGVTGLYAGNLTIGGNVLIRATAGSLVTNYRDASLGAITGNGTLTVTGTKYGIIQGAAVTSSGGTLNLVYNVTDSVDGVLNSTGAIDTGGSVTANIASTSASNVMSGVISGATTNLIKSGVGSLSLTNANTYDGGTTISAGTLLINNTTGSGLGTGAVNVNAGTLGGAGFVTGGLVTVASGAVLQGGVGAGNGSLTLGGDVTLQSGSIIRLALGAAGTGDQLVRTGGAWTFDASQTFDLVDLGGFSGTYTLITGLTGSEAGLGNIGSWHNTSGLAGSFSLSGTDVIFTAVPEPSTYGLLGAAALAAVACVRRRRRIV